MKYSKDWNSHFTLQGGLQFHTKFSIRCFRSCEFHSGEALCSHPGQCDYSKRSCHHQSSCSCSNRSTSKFTTRNGYIPDPSIDKCYHDRGFHLLYWTLQFSFAIGNLHASSYYTSLQFKGVRVGKGCHFLNSIKRGDRRGKVKVPASFVRCDFWCSCKRPDDSNRRIIRGL